MARLSSSTCSMYVHRPSRHPFCACLSASASNAFDPFANLGGANIDRNPRSSRRLVAALGLCMLRRGSSYTGTRMHMNGFGGQRLTAFRADHYGIEHLLAA